MAIGVGIPLKTRFPIEIFTDPSVKMKDTMHKTSRTNAQSKLLLILLSKNQRKIYQKQV